MLKTRDAELSALLAELLNAHSGYLALHWRANVEMLEIDGRDVDFPGAEADVHASEAAKLRVDLRYGEDRGTISLTLAIIRFDGDGHELSRTEGNGEGNGPNAARDAMLFALDNQAPAETGGRQAC